MGLGKIWTYEEAREILPLIKDLTEEYYAEVMELSLQIKEEFMPENELEAKEEEVRDLIAAWSAQVIDMQIEVKGLWLVDFDKGDGYYCWHLGEEDLLYEHGYEEGFSGRKLIEKDQSNGEN